MTALTPITCPFPRVTLPLLLALLAGTAAAQSSYHVGTLAGQAGVPGATDGFDLAARFNGPSGVAIDGFGNLYVADAANHLIRKVVAGTREVVTLAGLAGNSGSADGVGSAARFNAPSGVAVTPAGLVYVADTYNHTIRVIAAGGIVTTLAGTAGASGATDGTGSGARFLYPYGVAVDAAGVVYVADTFNHVIRRVQAGGVVTTLAGLSGARGLVDGLGAAARFNYPFGLAAEPGGIVHVADSFNHAVRRVDAAGIVTTLAGNGGAGSADGVGGAAQFQQPSGIAVDGSGNVFVADTYNSTIRGIAPGGAVSTLAGLAANVGTADGLGSAARFNQPFGIASGGAGVLYLADTRNHTLRATTPVTAPTITSAASATFTAGLAGNFTVTALGAPAPTFSLVSGSLPSGLNFTSWGVIFGTPVSTEGSPFLVTIQASNGVPPAATQVLTLNVVPPPPPVIHGWSGNQSLYTGQSITLAVTASGAAPLAYQWRKNTVALAGATTSNLTLSNVQLGDAGTYDVVVSNGGGSTTSPAMAVTVSIPVPPVILVQPRGAELNTGNVGSFGVGAQGSAPLLYQWRRDGVAIAGATAATLMLGQVNAAHAGSYDVLVSNIAGTVVSQPATLAVHPPIQILAQPENVAGYLGMTATFRVTATGTGTPQYQWRRAGVNIPGATSSSLVLTDLTAAHAGVFDVVVSNTWGSLVSQLAVLTVADAGPVILLPPVGATLAAGGSYTLSVQAGGNHPLTYQWRRNGLALAGATQATLAITNAQTYQSGDYEVIVANARGIVTSPPARVTIVPQVRSFSARLLVGPEGAIGTFTVEGSQPKRLLLRAVGPGLAPFGLAGLLADPRLDVFDASGALIASNDQWSEAPDVEALADATAAVGAFALSRDSRDSAVLRSFAPGSYTVRATAASGPGGMAYLELHDADLANGPLSTIPSVTVRGRVAPGSGVVIGGMGSNGRGQRSFLLRAVGPALHLPEAVSDPAFLVVRDQALVGLNDNWDTVAADAAEVTAATARLGLPPLPAGAKDAALVLTGNVHAAPHTVQVSSPEGTSGVVLVELHDLATTRPAALPPVILSPPAARTVAPGAPFALEVVAAGVPAVAYQWSKDGVPVSGATGASLAVASAAAAHGGAYRVTVTNTAGVATSLPAAVTIQGLPGGAGATQAVVGSGYVAGGTVTITNTLSFAGAPSGLGWSVTLPAGWSFAAATGQVGEVGPAAGATGTLEWAWSTVPASPVTFTYLLNVPAGESGSKVLTATGIVREGGNVISLAATPTPFLVGSEAQYHSADTNADRRISLFELTRVIELFNTRNGSTRTGCYRVLAGSEDGFAPEPTRAASTVVNLTAYHAADSGRDGKISLFELTRVIELFNTRAGSQRTGQYHVQAGTEDGFAPGP